MQGFPPRSWRCLNTLCARKQAFACGFIFPNTLKIGSALGPPVFEQSGSQTWEQAFTTRTSKCCQHQSTRIRPYKYESSVLHEIAHRLEVRRILPCRHQLARLLSPRARLWLWERTIMAYTDMSASGFGCWCRP